MKMNDVIAHALRDMGVDCIFGVIGDANLFVVDKFIRNGGHYTSAAHEASAVVMALGYSQVTGRIGVATVTCGPGLTNALTPLVEGVKGHIPMVLITGDAMSQFKFHPQRISHGEFILATGAGYEETTCVEDTGRNLLYAFQRAYSERRPIVFNFGAYDRQWDDIGEYRPQKLVFPQRHTRLLDSPELEMAVGMIATAKRPIVLAGYGVVRSGQAAEVLRLAQRLDAPVMTTLRAKDLYRGDPLNLGVLGISGRMEALDAITVSDCIIAFGAGLNKFTSGHGAFLDGKRVILAANDTFTIGRDVIADATILGEPGAVADRMVYWLDEAEIAPSGFASEEVVRDAAAAIGKPLPLPDDAPLDGPVTIQEVMVAIDGVVEEKRILVTDGGRFMRQPWQLIQVTEPRFFISTNLFGAIGTGVGYGIGGATAEPGIPTVAVVGDGGFMLGGLAEFNTAVRHKLDLIVVLCNDGGYGAEYLHFTDRDLDPGLSLFNWPEFGPLAESLGGQGFTVHTRADLQAAMAFIRGRDRSRPTLIDIKLDPETMPRTF